MLNYHKTLKQSFLFILSFFIGCISVLSQSRNNILVYSVQGNVLLSEKGRSKKLAMYDSLMERQVLVFKPASRLSYISLIDKSFHEVNKTGTFTVAQLLQSEKKENGTMHNLFGYIADNFIEKGKMLREGLNYKSAGVVERGTKDDPMIFPFNNTVICRTKKFAPVFNEVLAKTDSLFRIAVIRNGEVLQQITMKPGDSLELDRNVSPDDDISINTRWGDRSSNIKVSLADAKKQAELDSAINNIDRSMIGQSLVAKLLTRAMFYEDRACFVEALGCYELLAGIKGGDPKFNLLKNVFLRNHSNQ